MYRQYMCLCTGIGGYMSNSTAYINGQAKGNKTNNEENAFGLICKTAYKCGVTNLELKCLAEIINEIYKEG